MSRIAVLHAPSLAGGPLRLLNRLLHACALARARGPGWQAELVLDDALSRERDRALLLLNAFGDPMALPGPRNGRFTAADRAALAAAARDLMPPTAAATAAIERLLPPEGSGPLEAAAALWHSLLGHAGLRVTVRGAEDPPPAPVPEVAPEITWFAGRHLQLLRQVRIPPQAALIGEASLRNAATPRGDSRILAEARALAAALEQHLGALEKNVDAEDPGLLGTFARLRRQSRSALADFILRAERNARNRHGIRGARLHALAQALRPHDQPQEEHLGLLAASALFGLALDNLGDAVARFPTHAIGTDCKLLLCADDFSELEAGSSYTL